MRLDRISTLLVCCLVVSSGCYFGSTKSDKRTGYIANGAAVALGTLILVSSDSSGSCTSSDGTCGIAAGSNAIAAFFVSAVLIGVGGIGILRNVLSPTTPDATPMTPPIATSPAAVIRLR